MQEDLYYAILTPDGGKVVDTFLRNLFVWNTVDVEDSYLQTTDVKDSLGFTLARILRHTSSEYRYNSNLTTLSIKIYLEFKRQTAKYVI